MLQLKVHVCQLQVVICQLPLQEFRVAQLVKNPPTMQETWVQSLGWENALEKGKATLSSILAWRIPWVHGLIKSWTRLSDFHFISRHFSSAGTDFCAAATLYLPHALKVLQEWGTLCSGKTGRTGRQRVKYFQELIFWAQSLHLLVSRKALNPFMRDISWLWLAENFCKSVKNFCLVEWTSPSPKPHVYRLSPITVQQLLSTIWSAVSWDAVFTLPQRKLN